jgi:uncharacterized protein (TIGR03086 family)
MDIRELDRRAGSALWEMVSQIRPEQLWFPTPCADWTVHGLVRHLVSDNEGLAAAAVDGSAPVRTWTGGGLADNPGGAYRRSNARFVGVFSDEAALDRPVEVREFGTFPRRTALTFHLLGCIVHGWDLARALDLPYDPPAELVEVALDVARRIPDTASSRGQGAAFECAVRVPQDASSLDRLLGLLGRHPDWVSPLD